MKKIVILGGASFLGSHFTAALANAGHHVVSVSRASSKDPYHSNIKYVDMDVCNCNNFSNLDDDADFYINLISSTLPKKSPLSNLKNDILALNNILNFVKNFKNSYLIQLSSGGLLYGECTQSAVETSPLKPSDTYSKLKLRLEEKILESQINNLILRPSNIYGNNFSKVNINGLIQTIIYNIKHNYETIIWGTGFEKRDYLHINDFSNLLLKIVTEPQTGIYNVSSNISYETNYIINTIIELTNPLYNKITYKEDLNIISNSIISNEKVSISYNWSPSINIYNGIKYILNDFYSPRN